MKGKKLRGKHGDLVETHTCKALVMQVKGLVPKTIKLFTLRLVLVPTSKPAKWS